MRWICIIGGLLLLGLGVQRGSAAAIIANETLRVEIGDDGALVAVDLRAGQVWRQALVEDAAAYRQRVVAVDAAQRRLTLDCGMAGITREGKKVVAGFRIVARLHDTRPDLELTFEFTGEGQWREAAYPYVFARDGAEVCNLYPHAEGLLVPVRRSSPDWIELPGGELYGGTLSYLMCVGLVDLASGQGLLTLLPDFESTLLRWRDVSMAGNQTVTAPQLAWKANKGRFDRPFRVSYAFSDQGGYVALAQRYRRFFAEAGLHRTLREKAVAIPSLKELAGAPVFWAAARSPEEARAMADLLKADGVNRCLFAMPVIFAPQADYPDRGALRDAVRHVRSLGYEVYRYDQYRDAFRKGSSDNPHFQLNTAAWPDMIVRQENGKMVQAFGPDSGVICPQFFLPLARKTFEREFGDMDYSAWFLDCLGSVSFNFEAECYDPRHPCNRFDSRRQRVALLAELGRQNKLVGTECGLDYLIPYVHWFEGATTLVRWVNTLPAGDGRGVEDINSRQAAGPDDVYKRLRKLPLEGAAPSTISLSTRWRVPFYSLCHHDEVIVTWRWEDGMDKPPVYWRRKNLWSVLYGAPPMYRMFAQEQRQWHEQIAQTQRYISEWVREVAFDEMTSHRFVTGDRLVQESEFSSGRGVVVNFGDRDFLLGDGQIVKACDYLMFRRDGGRRSYSLPCANVGGR